MDIKHNKLKAGWKRRFRRQLTMEWRNGSDSTLYGEGRWFDFHKGKYLCDEQECFFES